jgi:predicted ArsR family transcriptional regulator
MDTSYYRDGKFLGRLGDVFGDPTRRSVYRHLRLNAEPCTAAEVAEEFDIHRTVARAHLEKLCEVGLLEVGTRRRPAGGRPAKTYVIGADRLEVMLPPRRYERLARLLLTLVNTQLEPSVAAFAAMDVGRAYGADMAQEIAGDGVEPPIRLAAHAVANWMESAGYAMGVVDSEPGTLIIEIKNCVYRELSQEHPDVVCGFDQGTLCGMLGVDASAHRRVTAICAGDDVCRHEFVL